MMSEAARRDTFADWPHMNYKWALPPQMAEAGFYHQPNTPESDRAVCFLCNVCLICWEPSDEPWCPIAFLFKFLTERVGEFSP